MQNAATDILRSNRFRANVAALGLIALGAWLLSHWIITGQFRMLIVAAVIVVGALVFLAILQNWRRGIYLFLVWLVFEDFIRKFSGNSTGMFFVKDIIAGMMFISMFAAWRRHRLPVFHPKFAKWLLLFVGLGIIQMFNPNTPSYFYGPLGFKLYFFYVPMMFAGYAYLRDEKDLQLFVKLNMWIALAVAGLGIAQSIVGPDFLNPSQLAPELQGLGKLVRESPLTHVSVARPTSVFVSDGRFAQFLILMYLLGFGAVGYLLLKKRAKPRLLLAAIGVTALATIMTGSRSAFIALMVNTLVLVAASSWGITASARRSLQVGRTVWRVTFAGGIAILLAALIFPSQTSARWAFYTETLSPASSASEFQYRAWQYPLDNVLSVFDQPNWIFGNGIGTASLGIQYVSAAIEEQRPSFGAESGYGQLILELGIIGPILWLLWTCVLFWESWKIVKSLRHTEFFPFSFALFWFLVYLLGIFTFYGLVAYQNYLMNVYAWLFVGMLFRLPGLVGNQRAISAPHANAQS